MTATSLAMPVQVAGDVATVAGAALERAQVALVLGTEPGECAWRTAFGVPLDRLRFFPNDAALPALVRVRIEDALAQWVPAATPDVVSSRAPGELRVRLALGAAGTMEVVR